MSAQSSVAALSGISLVPPATTSEPEVRTATPMNAFGFFAERNAVKDFSNNLCRLRDGHARAVEEQIAVRKCDVAVLHSSQFLPPRVSLQYTSFP